MQELANRLAIQNFVNAYMQEAGKGYLLSFDQQSSTQQAFSSGLTLLTLPLPSIQAECSVPLSYVSRRTPSSRCFAENVLMVNGKNQCRNHC